MNSFVRKLSKIAAQKKVFFLTFFTFEVPFNGLFAPTSRNRMPNIFRVSESLGKSNGKKWSQIWTFLFENCLKSQQKKILFFSLFLLLRYRLTVFLPPLPEVGCPIFLFGSGLKSPRKKSFFLLILPWSTLLWQRCYYPHRSRDALSPVCGIF